METRIVNITTRVTGDKELKRLSNQFASINKRVVNLDSNFSKFRNTFNAILGATFAGIGLSQLTQFSDEVQLLQDRIQVLTGDVGETERIFERLAEAARFTRQSISGYGESFNRVALATQELGLNLDQINALTTVLSQTFRLSGSTLSETTATIIQLSQGLSSGQLRGQELRSVLEQNAVIANLLGKNLGIARGQLIKFAESGKITAGVVIKTLIDNADDLNKSAENLSQTFEQTFTIALDAFKVGIGELNKELGISSAFAKGVDLLINNLDVVGSLFAGLSVLVVASLIPVFSAFAPVLLGIVSSIGLVPLAIAALVGSLTYLIVNFDKFSLYFQKFWLNFKIYAFEAIESVSGFILKFLNNLNSIPGLDIDFTLFTPNFDQEIKSTQKELNVLSKEIDKLNKNSERTTFQDYLKSALDSLGNFETKTNTLASGPFSTLNKTFRIGTEVTNAYNNAVKDIEIAQLNKRFTEGAINLSQYNEQLEKINTNYRDQNSIRQGLSLGLNQYINAVGSFTDNVANFTNNTFQTLEDSLFDFAKTGKFVFKDFAQSILDDLTRIILRMQVIAPLAGAINQSIGGSFGSFGAAPATSTFNSGVEFAATGTILNSPTMLTSGSRRIIAGEAGPEAIVPLKRGPGGELGLAGGGGNVNVIVNNNSQSQTSTRETQGPNGEKQIEIVVFDAVSKGFANGNFDKSLNAIYGLERRGR